MINLVLVVLSITGYQVKIINIDISWFFIHIYRERDFLHRFFVYWEDKFKVILFTKIYSCMISCFFKVVDRVLLLLGLRTFSVKVNKLPTDKATLIILYVICWDPLSKIPGSLDYSSSMLGVFDSLNVLNNSYLFYVTFRCDQ